jgi:hypothetical protein
VAVEVVTQATDHGQIEPMREQIEQRYGASPGAMLVDGGFVSLTDIDAVEGRGCRVYAPSASTQSRATAASRSYACEGETR